jgi:hypothetical protein
LLHNRQDPEERCDVLPSLGFPAISVTFLVAGTSGLKQDSPDPERRPQGSENGQFDRKWRPDEHRRPVGLTSVSAHVRRNACKTLAPLW